MEKKAENTRRKVYRDEESASAPGKEAAVLPGKEPALINLENVQPGDLVGSDYLK